MTNARKASQMTRKVQVVLSESQYTALVTAATTVTLDEGKPCSLSEWVRRAIDLKHSEDQS